jgi:hypothetical protein
VPARSTTGTEEGAPRDCPSKTLSLVMTAPCIVAPGGPPLPSHVSACAGTQAHARIHKRERERETERERERETSTAIHESHRSRPNNVTVTKDCSIRAAYDLRLSLHTALQLSCQPWQTRAPCEGQTHCSIALILVLWPVWPPNDYKM